MSNENKTIHDFELQLICDFFSNMERQGPGSPDVTLKALSFIDSLTDKSLIADIGCGTGGQTMVLAGHITGQITGLDLFPDFIDIFNHNAKQSGLQDRVKGIVGSMDNLPFQSEELDLIWSEGAIYNIGFERGLNEWRRYLKPGGYIAVSESSWFTDERPAEINDFWVNAYPEIDTIPNQIAKIHKAGYLPVATFILPENCWTEHYFAAKIEAQKIFLHKYAGNKIAEEFSSLQFWKIQCKLPPKTKRFYPLKTFNNAPLKSLDRWGYYYFSLFPSVCSHFTDTFSCQLNPVRRMYNTIHNGICYCRVSDCIIPIVRWQLRGDDDGLAPMSVLYYIEQDGAFLGIKVHKEEVIQYEQRAPFDSLEFRFQCAFYFCHLKRTHKFRSIRIICPYALLAGFIPHCCGKEALPGTG